MNDTQLLSHLLSQEAAAELTPATGTPARLARAARLWVYVVIAVSSLNFVLAVLYLNRTGDESLFYTHQALLPFMAIIYTFLGSATISHRPRNPIGWIFQCSGTLFLITGLAASVIDGVIPAALTTPALLDLATWLGIWIWLPAQILPLTFVFLLFPDGHLPTRRWRVIGWVTGFALVALTLGLAAHPGPLSDWDTGPNPYGIVGAESALNLLLTAGGVLLAIGFAGSICAVVVRFRRSRGIERAQMKWLVFAAVVVLAVSIFTIPLWRAGGLDSSLATEFSIILTNLTTLGIAAAVTVAIVRYRLYDIDIIINNTLVYGVMTAVILLIYSVIVGAAGVLFGTQGNWLLTLLATGVVAVLFQPVRSRAQRGVNRLLYGRRDEPFEVLAQLGQRLEQTVTPDAVYPTIVETLAQALRLPYVALQVCEGEQFVTAEATGRPPTEPVIFPLTNQGEVIGRLLVGRRTATEEFSDADQRILRNVARQAGAAVYGAKLTADLQRSRQQLVTSREEERRRLRRDLHDGLGPSLASLLLEARALRRMVRNDPAAAEQLADEMQTDIRGTIDDIRRLVSELRPPALDDLGLVAALQVMAVKMGRQADPGSPSLDIQIDAPAELPPLPAAIEVAAFRIVQEGLTNVLHHAQARHAVVHISVNGDLSIEIRDDGTGFQARREGGLGLLSMRERAVELGGRCDILSSSGQGTTIQANLPIY